MSLIRSSPFEEVLGAAEDRYFGSGFSRVRLSYPGGPRWDVDAGELSTPVRLEYPSDWSRRAPGSELVPHLSTIDVIEIASALAGAYLHAVHGLSVAQIRASSVSEISLRAGMSPEAVDSALTARIGVIQPGAQPDDPVPGSTQTLFSCAVGDFRATILVEHPRPEPRIAGIEEISATAAADRLDASTQPTARAHSRALYIQPSAIAFGFDEGRSSLWGSPVREVATSRTSSDTIGADRGEVPNIVDNLILSSQLAQAHLLAAGGVSRAQSGTMWMRRAHFWLTDDIVEPMRFTADSLRELRRGDDGWRLLDAHLEGFGGVHGTASLAMHI